MGHMGAEMGGTGGFQCETQKCPSKSEREMEREEREEEREEEKIVVRRNQHMKILIWQLLRRSWHVLQYAVVDQDQGRKVAGHSGEARGVGELVCHGK